MATEKHTIDAADRKLGRLASEVATVLMGKNSVDYKRNEVADVEVTVENAAKLAISAQKLDNKEYDRYSGHPDGRKVQTARELVEDKGYGELVRRAVRGMLPKNKLTKPTMKNLVVTE